MNLAFPYLSHLITSRLVLSHLILSYFFSLCLRPSHLTCYLVLPAECANEVLPEDIAEFINEVWFWEYGPGGDNAVCEAMGYNTSLVSHYTSNYGLSVLIAFLCSAPVRKTKQTNKQKPVSDQTV